MCTRLISIGLHDAPNAKVLSHLHFLAISMHNEQVSWVDLNSVLCSRNGISHGSPNLCGQHLRDARFGSTVGSTVWKGRDHEPWRPPGWAGCPKRRLTLLMGFTTPKINRASAV